MTRVEAKNIAKQNLQKDFGLAIVVMLLNGAVISLLSSFGIGVLLFESAVIIGYNLFNIKLMKTKTADLNVVVEGFTKQDISRVIVMSLLKYLYLFLWSLLFLIVGIVKSYSYALTEYIAINDDKLTATECITKSREIMNGHKMELFKLDLSFIWWYILCCFIPFIAIWLIPYIMQTRMIFLYEKNNENNYKSFLKRDDRRNSGYLSQKDLDTINQAESKFSNRNNESTYNVDEDSKN